MNCLAEGKESLAAPGMVYRAGDGGILAALWLFAEQFHLGMDIVLRRIPIRQETVEICEILDVNPYQLYAKGAVLIGTCRCGALLEELESRGVMAADIGRIFPGSVRRILHDDTPGYLNVPRRIDEMREGTVQALLRGI